MRTVIFCTFVLLASACANTVNPDAEAKHLLALHERVLEAHRNGDVDAWMDAESDPYISANSGTITFPSASERRSMRESYLQATTFTVYRDLGPPAVRVSADGTLGWVICEVEILGRRSMDDGSEASVEAVYAWIELYEKRGGSWKMIGNVSNRRP